MRNVLAIVRREVNAFFFSFLGYIVVFVFVGLTGFFFHNVLWRSEDAGITAQVMFGVVSYTMMLIAPLITMRLIAEEVRTGTIETIMTAPITDTELVLGKFFGALIFYIVILLPTLVHVGLLTWLGKPDLAPILSGYLGLLLMGGLFLSIGLLCSSLTRNQIVAAVVGIVVLLLLFVIGALAEWRSGWVYDLMRYLGFMSHQESFARGIIDTRDLVYYLSLTAFFLFLSVKAVESRKWRAA